MIPVPIMNIQPSSSIGCLIARNKANGRNRITITPWTSQINISFSFPVFNKKFHTACAIAENNTIMNAEVVKITPKYEWNQENHNESFSNIHYNLTCCVTSLSLVSQATIRTYLNFSRYRHWWPALLLGRYKIIIYPNKQSSCQKHSHETNHSMDLNQYMDDLISRMRSAWKTVYRWYDSFP